MNKVTVELAGNPKGRGRLLVRFRYDPNDVLLIRSVRGRRWREQAHAWSVPANLETAHELRQLFGRRMEWGPKGRRWAQKQVQRERTLLKLQQSDGAYTQLEHTPKLIGMAINGVPLGDDIPDLPKHHPFRQDRESRVYQYADIKFMSMGNCINANDVGTGKTLEAIGAVFEAEAYPQPLLIVAKRRSLISVWKTELERFTDYAVHTSESPTERNLKIEGVLRTLVDLGYDRWALILIADDLRLAKERRTKDEAVKKDRRKRDDDPLAAGKDYRGNLYRFRSEAQRDLLGIEYGAFVIDEFHDTGLNNRRALFYLGAKLVKAQRKWVTSATPIGGKPRRLWAVLNFLYPQIYTSEWRWIEENLELTEEEFYGPGGIKQKAKKVGDIKDEEQFYENHRKHMIRRSKLETLPGLPPEIELLVETPMLPSQRADYTVFDRAHEIMLGDKRLSGSIVLSQYTRLHQMANTKLQWDRDRRKPISTLISGKLDPLMEKLDENGIRKTDYEPGARTYIGVLTLSFADVIAAYLTSSGIDNMLLTGRTKDSAPILQAFDADTERPFVIVMTVKTGGSGLNLERANSAHLLDEPWDPDIEYQFFGRGNRGARTTNLRCYTYRTPDSIQEYIAEVAGHKKITNKNVLDFVPAIEQLRRSQ